MMSLPILSSRFFEVHRPDPGFFSKWRDLFPWSELVVPVYEWQGVLYVGCLRPPNKFPKSTHQIVYLLCEEASLQELWLTYNSPEYQVSESEALKIEAPELSVESDVSEEPEVSIALESAPPENLEPLKDIEPLDEPKTSPMIANDQPFELQDDPTPEAAIAEASPQEELLELNVDFANPSTPPPSLSALKTNPDEEKTSILSPLQSETPLTQNQSPEEEITAPEIKAQPQSRQFIIGNDHGGEVTRSSITKLVSTPPAQLDTWLQDVFAEMKKGFQKSMVLIKEGDKVNPWKWDPEFQITAPATKAAISLQTPSPFRIVFRTHKPYHGYIVPNDLNTKFFSDWNKAQMPEHLTIAPLMIEDHMIGMLIGIGGPQSDTQGNLKLAEKVAHSMVLQIQESPESFRAA